MNFCAASAGQIRSVSPCRSTQGLARRWMGRKFTPWPRAARVNSSPEPLHSDFSQSRPGQNPKVRAAAKVFRGACASTAYAKVAPEETPTRTGERYVGE